MTQYLVAIHHPENYDPSLEGEAMVRDIDVLNEEMNAAGARFFAGGLESATKAKSLRKQSSGDVVITDGPYLETKEHIGGFWILEAADMDEALASGRKAIVARRSRCEPSIGRTDKRPTPGSAIGDLNEPIEANERRRRQNTACRRTAWPPKAHSQEENNAEKEGWRNRNQKLRIACCTRCDAPSDGTGCLDTLFEDGLGRPIPHDRSGCRDSPGAKCSTGVHFTRCRGSGSRTSWFRNCSQRQKRFRVCVVARSWTSAPDSDFWNPKVRVPMCVNAPAARSYLLHTIKWTDLALAGRTKVQMTETIAAAIDKKELPAMESGAMCYMMSKQGYGGDSIEHWPSHLMFFYSDTDPTTWGANLPDSPILGSNDTLEHLTTFVVPVQRWSDGTDGTPSSPASGHHSRHH